MKLALDNHCSPLIASTLRAAGSDVVAAIERGWEAVDDESLRILCKGEDRVLITNNVGDFGTIARTCRSRTEGRP